MADPATTTATAAADAGSGGLPQFDLAQWPGQMVWVLIVFAILYVLFARVFVPRVGGAIDMREQRIAGDIGEARRLKAEAEAASTAAGAEMDEARGRARKLALDAHDAAKSAGAARQAGEDAKVAATLEAAEARIAAARGEAMGHVRAIAADTALAMIEKLSGTPASPAEVERALAGHA
ncbi:MAG: hypothetical protein ABI376_06070 [Caulobacteraceae bacterium]